MLYRAVVKVTYVSALRNCVEVEVAVLGGMPVTVRMVSVDVKQH